MRVIDANWAKDLLLNIHRAEELPFTHICKSDKEQFPSCFAVYARVIDENNDSVTVDRFNKWGAVHIGEVTLSRKDFERYYKEIKNEV